MIDFMRAQGVRSAGVRTLVLGALVLALAAAPVRALARSPDPAATHAFVAADYALARARVALIHPVQAKVERFNSMLAAQCPNVGAGAPETEASTPMSHEVARALWSIAYGSAAGPTRTFARAIASLHWTNARFGRAVRHFASILTALASTRPPDVCGDVRAWTASGFTTIPPHVTELNERVESLVIPELPWKLVRPDLQGRDASHVSYILHAETKLLESEFTLGQSDWYQVLATLGLPP